MLSLEELKRRSFPIRPSIRCAPPQPPPKHMARRATIAQDVRARRKQASTLDGVGQNNIAAHLKGPHEMSKADASRSDSFVIEHGYIRESKIRMILEESHPAREKGTSSFRSKENTELANV